MHNILARLAALLIVAHAAPALACSCVRMSFEETVARTPAVFEGRVLETRDIAAEHSLVARVDASAWRKGRPRRSVVVVTSSASTMCGYPLVPGRTYTFGGAFDRRGRLATNMCVMVPLNSPRAR
jgi:hypothetical protein